MVYSTVSEQVLVHDKTEEELVQYYVGQEEAKIRSAVIMVLNKYKNGEKPYYNYTRSFKEAIQSHMTHGGSPLLFNVQNNK